MTTVVLGLIHLYQRAISPALGPACRFEPTCSRYAYEAIERHGLGRGVWLAVRRLLRCRPGGATGYDPVPDVTTPRTHEHAA
jgi:putative membrane protein insertion efficiency factor